MKKRPSLAKTYYLYFLILIVLPIIIVAVVLLGILRNMMLDSVHETIDLAQQNTANAISNEVQSNSLRLSHFLLSNEGQALELAEAIATGDGITKYQSTVKLKELYRLAVAPSREFIAIMFFTKSGEVISLKEELGIPVEEMRANTFYQHALEEPGRTHSGIIGADFTYVNISVATKQKALAISYAPKGDSAIEMVCWYTYTSANSSLTDYSREANLGEMYLVDENGGILAEPLVDALVYSVPEDVAELALGRHRYEGINGRNNDIVISEVSGTPWRVVSLVDAGLLLSGFNRISLAFLAVSMVILLLFLVFSIIFLQHIITPVNTMISSMARVEKGDLDTRLVPRGQSEIRMLMSSFNSMIAKTQDLLISNEQQQKDKMKAEIQALQSQINPHFLVNTLNSIRFTAMVSHFDSIRTMAEALIKILTTSFSDPGSVYTIGEEVEMLESYIYLMKIRYSENFEVIWNIPDACRGYGIPRLLVQPIVENAITHGFEDGETPGTITITMIKANEDLFIVVSDNGKGMSEEMQRELFADKRQKSGTGHGIGVMNVHRRIQLNYGAEYGLSVESKVGSGTSFTLKIPARKQEALDA